MEGGVVNYDVNKLCISREGGVVSTYEVNKPHIRNCKCPLLCMHGLVTPWTEQQYRHG